MKCLLKHEQHDERNLRLSAEDEAHQFHGETSSFRMVGMTLGPVRSDQKITDLMTAFKATV